MAALRKASWTGIVLMLLALGILVAIVWTGFGLLSIPPGYQNSAEIALPVLVLVGAVGLFVALAFLAGAFAAMGQSNRSQALGLPEGSVRALIALLLITLFAITAIFLYRQVRIPLENPMITHYTGISEQQLAEVPAEQVIAIHVRTEGEAGAEQKVYDVDRRIPPVEAGEASQRFAQQILTSVSTLVVAVAGFYFGTRSVAAARGEAVPLAPKIDYIKPETGSSDQEKLEITNLSGSGFVDGARVRLRRDDEKDDIEASEVQVASPGKITCVFNLKGKREGKWDVVVLNPDETEGKKAKAFEIAKPAPPAQPATPNQPAGQPKPDTPAGAGPG